MITCVLHTYATGGDSFITQCLWEQGLAITDPGFSFHNPGVRLFDPTDARTTPLLMALFDGQPGGRGPQCPGCVKHMQVLVSAHIASRGFENFEDAAMLVEQIAALEAGLMVDGGL